VAGLAVLPPPPKKTKNILVLDDDGRCTGPPRTVRCSDPQRGGDFWLGWDWIRFRTEDPCAGEDEASRNKKHAWLPTPRYVALTFILG
jgi:hypothetical protein